MTGQSFCDGSSIASLDGDAEPRKKESCQLWFHYCVVFLNVFFSGGTFGHHCSLRVAYLERVKVAGALGMEVPQLGPELAR